MSPKLASTAISTGVMTTKGVVGLLKNRNSRIIIEMKPTRSDFEKPCLIALSQA